MNKKVQKAFDILDNELSEQPEAKLFIKQLDIIYQYIIDLEEKNNMPNN